MRRWISLWAGLLLTTATFAQLTQMTNLPTVYVDTYSGRNITSKSTYVLCTLTWLDGEECVTYDSVEIRGRGNSTWGLAKKPYRIRFKTPTKLLGKGFAKARSWTLLANHADKSLIRNAVTFDMGTQLGQPFAPAARFVDLVLNGTYFGNYQVSDQVNVGGKRVDIVEQDIAADAESNITGGYLLEVDGFGTGEPVYFRTSKNLIVTIHSPDEDIINTAQKNYIRNYLNGYEAALFNAKTYKDPVAGYRALTDTATLVSWYIASELSANPDCFWSTYIYKDCDDDRLYFGPLWDYDIAYNNCDRIGDVTRRTMVDAAFGSDLTKVWVKQMTTDAWFNEAVNRAWTRALNEGLEQHMLDYVDSLATLLDESQELNYRKYSISSHVYNEIFLYTSYADYISQLKSFITDHIDYLSSAFQKRVKDTGGDPGGDTGLKPFVIKEGYYYRISNRGVNMSMDLAEPSEGTSVVVWNPEYGRVTQQWLVNRVGDYYQFINSATGLALNDPSPSSATGTAINVVVPDATDDRQLWSIVTVNYNGNYNIINLHTGHAINNSGGGSTNGNSIISYTSDERNAVSNNRQWSIEPDEHIPDYVSEEVREALAQTIEEAKAFVEGLSKDVVGDGFFQLVPEEVETLERMIQDALQFSSMVEDDYILCMVGLQKQMEKAKVMTMPTDYKFFTIRHVASGLYASADGSAFCLAGKDTPQEDRNFRFVATDTPGEYLMLSESGKYISMAGTNGWSMTAVEQLPDETLTRFTVSINGNVHNIGTCYGLCGTDGAMSGSAIYGDKGINKKYELARWIISYAGHDYEDEFTIIAGKQATLKSLLQEAESLLSSIAPDWVGEEPFMHSKTIQTELTETCRQYAAGVEPDVLDEAIAHLQGLIDGYKILNTPSEETGWLLINESGFMLTAEEGLVFTDSTQVTPMSVFRFVPVRNAADTYYLAVGDRYVSLIAGTSGTMALTTSPRASFGKFVIQQVSPTTFNMTSYHGLMGADEPIVKGTHLSGQAMQEGTTEWMLRRAPDIPDGIQQLQVPDYAVKYNLESKTISFVSDNMEMLNDVHCFLYTTGGRLLYTFSAGEGQEVSLLPTGTYILRWTICGQEKSTKLLIK
ncbi:MAG: CotH kinase family protein [Bacteroidaceae bacterium]|nr:CotH kinase family protein [Bacteroidaceae bacterium]